MAEKMLPKSPDFPGAFVSNLSKVLLLASVGTVLTTSPGWSAVLKPTSVNFTVPTNSQNGTRNGNSAGQAYVDDVLLNNITFGGTTFRSNSNINNSQFRAVERVNVRSSGASNVNAEFGDNDTGSDGNPNPFVSAGKSAEGVPVPENIRESTDPSIQSSSIKAAYNSLSVSQGVDGEGPEYNLQLIFQNGVTDNSSTADQVPELVFFERGKFIDTIEVDSGQELGVVGIDLNDFGLAANQVLYGVSVTSINGSGADLYGQFVSAENIDQFRNREGVPEPLTILGSGIALGFGVLMQRKSSRKLQKA